jgi:hypothetical protein
VEPFKEVNGEVNDCEVCGEVNGCEVNDCEVCGEVNGCEVNVFFNFCFDICLCGLFKCSLCKKSIYLCESFK